MAITTYEGWLADGKPGAPAQPIADMIAMFQSHGFECGWYPDQRHLTAHPPEDHCPFSNTPWPGAQPYPHGMALDLMPHVAGDGKSLAPIARAVIADVEAGIAPWIKYMNWTDESGAVHHTRWQPGENTAASSDSGHIHISIRTDFVASHAAAGWDPLGGDMPLTSADLAAIKTAVNGGADSLTVDQLSVLIRTGKDPRPDSVTGTVGGKVGLGIADVLTAIQALSLANPDVLATLADQIAVKVVASEANSLTNADHAAVVADTTEALKDFFAAASK